jgi:signal peptidase I
MEPTYGSGKILLINRLQRSELQRWDIVVVDTEKADVEKKIIKRVVGLPGETINITQDGEVSINGTTLNEPYVVAPTDVNLGRVGGGAGPGLVPL